MVCPVREWQSQSKCNELTAEQADNLFFPSMGGKSRRANIYCRTCPVRDICLQTSVDAGFVGGYWAGLTDDERLRFRKLNIELAAQFALPAEPVQTRKIYLALYTAEATEHHKWMDEVEPTAEELLALEVAS